METLFTKKEVAEYLKVSERTVDRLIHDLGVKVFKVGRAIRIPETSIIKMLRREEMSSEERNQVMRGLYGD